MLRFSGLLVVFLAVAAFAEDKFDQAKDWSKAESIYQFSANDINDKDTTLDKYKGHPTIIVNVASQCKLTDVNYKQLQGLYEKYGPKGLRIAAFPSNEFAGQEPGTNKEILEFVTKNFNVTFDMYAKTEVNGENAHPLYKWLKTQDAGAGSKTGEIQWNFTKFLIDKNGKVIARVEPKMEPITMEDIIVKNL